MKKTERAAVKVMWIAADKVLRSDYFSSAAEAEKAILKSRNRRWGKDSILFWSETLSRYVSVPEGE
jgi:hypothetical protein